MGFPLGTQGMHLHYCLDPTASGAALVCVGWQPMWPERPALAFLGPGQEDTGQGRSGIEYSVPGQNSSSIWGGSHPPTQSWRLLLSRGAAHLHPRTANATCFVRGTERERGWMEREEERGEPPYNHGRSERT